MPATTQDAVAVLSLSDVSLHPDEVTELLHEAIALSETACASIIRSMRQSGVAEIFGNSWVKIHDAMRILGGRRLSIIDEMVAKRARSTLKAVLLKSLERSRDTSRFALYARMLVETRDVRTLVALIGEETFHELGVGPHIWHGLETLIDDPVVRPIDRFWALDGLIFSDMKHGRIEGLQRRFDLMEQLIRDQGLGADERLSFIMKRMNFEAGQGDDRAVERSVDAMRAMLPDKPKHH